MDLHHFVAIIKDRFKDSVSEAVGQIRARDSEIVDP
jgi:hypothetical protein